MGPEVTTVLRFLMGAAAELSSSLELEEVFHKIATGLRPLIDYHLFCVMLWNEETQLLENSFSMKYGEAIPQKGGFPWTTACPARRPLFAGRFASRTCWRIRATCATATPRWRSAPSWRCR